MTNKINGIDVSKYFIEVVDEGGSTIDYKILPNSERLLVEKIFEQNQQLKRMQQELDIKEKMLDKFMIGSGETLEKLQKENEKLKADLKGETEQCQKWYQLETDKHFQMLKYEQALEEIRKEITPVCAYCNNIDGFTIWDDCENVCEKGVIKYLKIIDEALNDRD